MENTVDIYSRKMPREVRLEFMLPEQIDAAKVARAAVYVPFGAIEWHGHHNPVGLDAIKAHAQLVGLASRAGGIVYPPVYFGAGGGHTEWPHTFMVDSHAMQRIVTELLHGFERAGFTSAILLSGHYPNSSEYLERASCAYRDAGGTMRVLTLIENQVPGVDGDHAAKYETSSMLHLYPGLADMKRLNRRATREAGGRDDVIDWMVDTDPSHPCYGLVGIDPRFHASADVGRRNTDALIEYLQTWLDESPPTADSSVESG